MVVEARYESRPQGGVGVRLARGYELPALPDPHGVESVRVTDATNGEVIFEDNFDGPPSALWSDETNEWYVDGGLYKSESRRGVTTGFQPWDDYVLEATFKNITEATVFVRATDFNNAIALDIGAFRLAGGQSIALYQEGTGTGRVGGGRLELERSETVQSMLSMLIGPYPIGLLMIVSAIVLVALVRVRELEEQLRRLGALMSQVANPLVLGLSAGGFVLLLYLLYVVGEHVPHVPDSVLYTWQAKTFASFHITAPAPPVQESFSIFHPAMQVVVDGRWFPQYPFGHAAFLAIGQLFGAIWLIPPLLGAASIALIYCVGKRVYSLEVGMIAAVLLLFSPFFLMTASNFMSHNTGMFVILAMLFLYTMPAKRRWIPMFFSGVFLGLLLNIRPLTGAAFVPMMALFVGFELLRAGPDRKKVFREDLAMAAGALLLFIMYFLYNQATTGSFTETPYASQGTFSDDFFGFSGRHSLSAGMQNDQELLSLMLLVANGWPIAIGLIVAVLPFILGTRHRWDYFLALSFLVIAASPILYRSSAVMHGPRFWFETMPFVILLTARGFQHLRDAARIAGDWLATRIWRRPSFSSVGISSFAVYSLVAGLVAFSVWGWLLEQRVAWSGIGVTTFTPERASRLEGFNYTDRRLPDSEAELDLENALVLVDNCVQWWCYGSVFWLNSPELDGDVVWAERQNDSDDRLLLEAFPERDVYVASYSNEIIVPATREEVLAGIPEVDEEETPTVIEDDRTPEERDEIRRQDLAIIEGALEQRAALTGDYPTTDRVVQTFCTYRNLDAGCIVESVLAQIPSDPLGHPIRNGYWYRSDGVSYVLMAVQEASEANIGCPADLEPRVPEFGTYCVQGVIAGGGPTPTPGTPPP
ncbi:MAG: glycosyltransferase family 39 protein, partial [Dehalococcoidia bacterium]